MYEFPSLDGNFSSDVPILKYQFTFVTLVYICETLRTLRVSTINKLDIGLFIRNPYTGSLANAPLNNPSSFNFKSFSLFRGDSLKLLLVRWRSLAFRYKGKDMIRLSGLNVASDSANPRIA